MEKIIKDERVVAQNRKILSYGFGLLWIALLIATLVQWFLLDAPLEQYAVEFCLFLGAPLYILICTVRAGNLPIFSKKFFIIDGVMGGATVATIIGIVKYNQMQENVTIFFLFLLLFFVGVALLIFFIDWLLMLAYRKRQDKLFAKLDDEEKKE